MPGSGGNGSTADRVERVVVALGLSVAVTAGAAAGSFESVAAQSVLYALSSMGFVVATALLAFQQGVQQHLLVAGGFLILTVAETMLWVSGRPGDAGYEIGFAGGVMFYAPGLLLASLPAVYPLLVRVFGSLAAGVWALGAFKFLQGADFAHTDALAVVGYTLLSVFFAGVAWTTLRETNMSTKDIPAISTVQS